MMVPEGAVEGVCQKGDGQCGAMGYRASVMMGTLDIVLCPPHLDRFNEDCDNSPLEDHKRKLFIDLYTEVHFDRTGEVDVDTYRGLLERRYDTAQEAAAAVRAWVAEYDDEDRDIARVGGDKRDRPDGVWFTPDGPVMMGPED